MLKPIDALYCTTIGATGKNWQLAILLQLGRSWYTLLRGVRSLQPGNHMPRQYMCTCPQAIRKGLYGATFCCCVLPREIETQPRVDAGVYRFRLTLALTSSKRVSDWIRGSWRSANARCPTMPWLSRRLSRSFGWEGSGLGLCCSSSSSSRSSSGSSSSSSSSSGSSSSSSRSRSSSSSIFFLIFILSIITMLMFCVAEVCASAGLWQLALWLLRLAMQFLGKGFQRLELGQIRGTLFGVLIIRILLFRVLY